MWAAIGSIATALGVIFIGWQVWETRKQNVTAFEDELSHQYREILKTIPIDALLGEELSPEDFKDARDGIYHYLDLSNEQVYLRRTGRIRRKTWASWCEGIQSNLSRKAFAKVWDETKLHDVGSLSELKKLEDSHFKGDPERW